MNRFCVGLLVAAFVCGIIFLCGATAEASVLGSLPDMQCAAAPILVKPIVNFVIILITVAAFFCKRRQAPKAAEYICRLFLGTGIDATVPNTRQEYANVRQTLHTPPASVCPLPRLAAAVHGFVRSSFLRFPGESPLESAVSLQPGQNRACLQVASLYQVSSLVPSLWLGFWIFILG